jgi:uncharacterized protein
MMRKFFIRMALILAGGLVLSAAGSDRLLQSLRPTGYVSDFAGVMQPADRAAVERLFTELEQKTGAQAAVVTLKSLDGGQIDDFANRLFERWGIGKKGADNGLLLIASIADRKVRIETGYGLEGALPDAAAGRLLDQYVLPAFRAGHFSGGLRAGATALAAVAAAEFGAELTGVPARYGPVAEEEGGLLSGIFSFLFLLGFIWMLFRHPWLLLFLLSSGGGRGSRGGGFGGGGFGGFGGGMSGGGGASRGW